MSANTTTSVGSGPARSGNESHGNSDGRGNKTLGENSVGTTPAVGAPELDGAPDMPAGVPGSTPKQSIDKGPQSYPDGPNVEASPWELDAARGKLPDRE